MSYKEISKILSVYVFFLAIALCVPLGVAIYYEFIASPELHLQPHSTLAFILTIVICVILGICLRWFGREAVGKVFRREGIVIVGIIWFLTATIGGLPFIFSGTFESPLDAYFETMSGLTTTGASVMYPKKYDPVTKEEVPYRVITSTNPSVKYEFYGTIKPVTDPKTGKEIYTGVEAVSKGVLFWRSFTQWLGGMGIVVLFVAILPALGVGGKVLFQTEVPGPMKDSFTPRIKETASVLWVIYLGITILEIISLMVTNDKITWFEATTISFSTLSTGGFCVRNASIGTFDNAATDWIVIIFMICGGINFIHYFHVIKGKVYRIFEPELILYLLILLCGSIIASCYLIGQPKSLLTEETGIFSIADSLRYGFFQVISAQTSTGFATANFNYWPFVVQALMLSLMYVGAMSGSTGGGIKVARYYLLSKILRQKVEYLYRPETVQSIRIGKNVIDNNIQTTVLSFFVIVIGLALLGLFIYIFDGVDPRTSLTVVTCMLNNIGFAFGMAGPTESFTFLPPVSKFFSTFWMVLGRLEFFALLILLLPRLWRGK